MLRQLRFLQPTFDALGDDNRFETHVDDVFALKSNTYFFLLFVVRVCVSVCQEKEGPLQSRCLLDDHRKGVYRLRKGGYGGPFFFVPAVSSDCRYVDDDSGSRHGHSGVPQ